MGSVNSRDHRSRTRQQIQQRRKKSSTVSCVWTSPLAALAVNLLTLPTEILLSLLCAVVKQVLVGKKKKKASYGKNIPLHTHWKEKQGIFNGLSGSGLRASWSLPEVRKVRSTPRILRLAPLDLHSHRFIASFFHFCFVLGALWREILLYNQTKKKKNGLEITNYLHPKNDL